MPGESMINADGEVLVGADGFELVSDEGDLCAECCGGPGPCEAPPRMAVCAAYDLFNLAPAPGDASRRQVLLPLPNGQQTTMLVELRAQMDWSAQGGAQSGDVTSYVLKTGGMNDSLASELVPLAPVLQQDAGGCFRIVEWRKLAVLWFDQVINGSGAVSTYTVGACVHLYMTASGWAMAIDIIDGTRTGTFVFRRPGGGAGDSKGGFSDGGHQCTLEGLGQTRVPLGTQVVSGRGTLMTAGLGDYLEPPAGVAPRGCPPFLGALSVRASPGTKCAPGQVFAPGRFRMRWHAVYDYSQNDGQGTSLVTQEIQDFVVEFRDPITPPEVSRTVTLDRYTVKGASNNPSGGFVIDDVGTLGNTATALETLSQIVRENQEIGLFFPAHRVDMRYSGGSGCAGRVVPSGGSGFITEWSGADTLTSRTARWTLTSVGSQVVTTGTAVMTWTLEAIDVLTCSGPGIAPPMPPVRTLAEAGALVGRLLRGEM